MYVLDLGLFTNGLNATLLVLTIWGPAPTPNPNAQQRVASGSGMITPTSQPSRVRCWLPAPNVTQPSGFYYFKIGLASGRPAALIDPGAWTRAAGEDCIKARAALSQSGVFSARNELMETPLKCVELVMAYKRAISRER